MDPRYRHPLVTDLWSPEWTYNAWLLIERTVLKWQRTLLLVPDEETRGLAEWLEKAHVGPSAMAEIRRIERRTKHDVAAFLEWLRMESPGHQTAPLGQWLHFGLTSSDLVDTAQGMRFRALQPILEFWTARLGRQLEYWRSDETPLVGMTHGQPAEPTSMRARATHWWATLVPAVRALVHATGQCRVAKLSGPVGTFAHNPPRLEREVAVSLELVEAGAGASQIVPRTQLALWASSAAAFAAACAKIATDVRLMNMMGEVQVDWKDGQVGSSSMAHKRNPIVAEQICGLARAVQGYASMLQPLDLWLERDISNSSVERIAVPALWHLTLHLCRQATELLHGMSLSAEVAEIHLQDKANALWTHKRTLDAIRGGMPYEDARELALAHDHESYDIRSDAAWFTRDYPKGGLNG